MHERAATQRSVAALRTALVGHTITSFEANRLDGPRPSDGAAIERVECRGRHVVFVFDDGVVLDTRPRHSGTWRLHRTGARRRRKRHPDRIVISTAAWVAACITVTAAETWREADQNRHPRAGRPGPDPADPASDLHECAARLAHYDTPSATVADALLDHRVMSGVGNVYRCEVLWSCGIHPWATVGSLPQSTCLDLVLTAAGLMRANSSSPVRVTAPDVPGGLAVYGRNGQRCARCGEVIRLNSTGTPSRLLYWCPGCQVGCEPYPGADSSAGAFRPADHHPAAETFLTDIWRGRDAS